MLYNSINCRMRHGKIGLKLGTCQKYYISRCEEKQSIQLTITVAGSDAKCVKERSEIINKVAEMLDRIMKVFMPAAKSPEILIPCSKCDKLHIELKHVRYGDTIYCPSSIDDDSPLADNYYIDLLLSAAGKKIIVTDCFDMCQKTIFVLICLFYELTITQITSLLETKLMVFGVVHLILFS